MQAIYKGKHSNGKVKMNFKARILLVIVMLAVIALDAMSGILSVLCDDAQLINEFTISGKYTVIFEANGGTGTMANQSIYNYQSTPLTQNAFERDLYEFENWNTQADGSGTTYEDEESVLNISPENTSIRLYAQWTEIQGVAEVNGEYFGTLQAAINAVHNGVQTTVRLLRNVEENVTIPAGKDIIFNLGNKTITGNTTSQAAIENNGKLLIQNGTVTKISSTQVAVINNNSGAELKITGGSIIAHGTTKAQAIYNNNGTLEVSGTAYISSESSNRATITNINGGVSTITGGTIIAENFNAISNTPVNNNDQRGGTITIGTKDGEIIYTPVIQAKKNGVVSNYASIEFYDGIIKGVTSTANTNYISDTERGCYPLAGTENIDGTTYRTLVVHPSNTVTFSLEGGTMAKPFRYVDTGDEIGELPVPTQTGYKFDGWFTTADNTGTQIDEHTIINGDVTYYAHWTQLKEVRFDANQGSVDETLRYRDVGEEVGELPTPTRSGYQFVGWFTAADSTGTQIDEHAIVTANITYYAHWEKLCRINFNPNGGKVTERTRDVYENHEIGTLPSPTKTNNTFVGWFTERTGGTQITANTIVSNNTTYYAHWTGVDVASIDGVGYGKLQDAIDDVPTDNTETTIVFLRDIVENVDIDPGQNIVFDIGSYTLSNATNNAVLLNYGSIKIINGTITSSAGYATINSYVGATVEITGGQVLATGIRQALYNKGGLALISGDAYLSSVNLATDKVRGTVHNLDGGTTIITGGTISALNENAIYNELGTVIIGEKDGIVSTTTPVIISKHNGIRNADTLNFYDGIIKVLPSKPAVYGSLTSTEEGYDISYGTEVIDGTTYKTAYLDNSIRIPTAVTGLKYNKQLQTGVHEIDGAYTITGNTATAAGTYTATASLKYPSTSTWSDGTTTDKTITYTIAPATVTPTATADNKVYDGTTTGTGTITLTGVKSGDHVSATATSYTFASPDVGTDITVTASGITLSGADSANYVLSTTTVETTADITN